MPLYPAQKVIADKLLKLYAEPNYYRQQRMYLAGEMGVGKTYMASAVIGKMMKHHSIILVVPPTIVTKWSRVLSEYASNYKIKIFTTKVCLNDPELLLEPNCVNLIPNRNFNRLFTYDATEVGKLKFAHKINKVKGVPDGAQIKRHTIGITNYKRIKDSDVTPLLVYDEIHKASNSKLRCFKTLMLNTDCYGLFLTGTIFNMSLNSVGRLIDSTHPHLSKVADLNWNDIQIAPFMRTVWQYISLSIAQKQIKNSKHQPKAMRIKKVHQDIVPIKPVAIDDEELAFYKFAYIQLKSLGKTPSVAKLMASNFLDYPQRSPEIEIKESAGQNRLRRHTLDAVAMPLMNMNLALTKKYIALCHYLDRYGKGKRTLIYVTDHDLIKTLTAQLNKDGYSAKHLKSSLKPDQYSRYINSCYDHGTSVFVVDPRQVNVGVDIYGDVLVWYQLLLNMSDIIQAQSRIHRLSSKHNSKVIFLAYKLTYQEQLVDQISNADKYNAASYGIQKRNSLTKLTGVLLNEVNN